jgi:hypothetical protein
MITRINFEVFSPAMKAKLDPRYRRRYQPDQHPGSVEFQKSISPSDHKTALPFTTLTRAYGTYNWRNP